MDASGSPAKSETTVPMWPETTVPACIPDAVTFRLTYAARFFRECRELVEQWHLDPEDRRLLAHASRETAQSPQWLIDVLEDE